jgi:hypothetical protein
VAVARGHIVTFDGTSEGYTITETVTNVIVRSRTFAGGVTLSADVQANFFPWGGADAVSLNITNDCRNRVLNLLPTGIVEVAS